MLGCVGCSAFHDVQSLSGLRRSGLNSPLRKVDGATFIHLASASGNARFVSAILAKISRIHLDLQLKLAVRWHGELAAACEGFPGTGTRQFHVQAACYYVHDFQLRSAELIFARGHHADGGRTFRHFERDGFDGAVEVLVDLEHLVSFAGWKEGRQYAQASGLASPGSASYER
ncbi:conserved hypothetical protein [Stutzerimonas stutzeri A1501]|uniref:Uncharacterized protein n=1 Tax=Stutzerimonas stutzeri (strain A1501) TaxID=379731 RepID=A4VKP1_STUS1|nr:conserved hypothetical protein [Stutzerimonas stutzeri A1501]